MRIMVATGNQVGPGSGIEIEATTNNHEELLRGDAPILSLPISPVKTHNVCATSGAGDDRVPAAEDVASAWAVANVAREWCRG
jgi:hypothetical protein